MRAILPLALALALTLSGCIQNMDALRSSLSATEESLEQTSAALDQTSGALNGTRSGMNASKALPVARISVFAPNGGLLYKSTFQADDPADAVIVPENATLSVIAGDSEALEPGATVTGFAWTLDGKPLEGGRQASVAVGGTGLYVVNLTVTDSNGAQDTHQVKLGVLPPTYDVTMKLVTGPIGGARGEGLAEEHTFVLAADESRGPSMVRKVVITAAPDVALDATLIVLDAEGATLGEADDAGHTDLDQTETVTLGALPLGEYVIRLQAFAGADPDGIPITIVVTYWPLIEGLTGDGHGHAH